MKDKQIEIDALDALLETPLNFSISIDHKDGLPDSIVSRKVVELALKPLGMGTLMKVTKEIMKMDLKRLVSVFEGVEVGIIEGCILVDEYAETVIQIIVLGVHNAPSDPPDWLTTLLTNNCTAKELFSLLGELLIRTGSRHFPKSTIRAIRMGLITPVEIIALEASGRLSLS